MKRNTSKKCIRNLLSLTISFAMVIGIFGGMKLDAKAANYTLNLASPEEMYYFTNKQIFKYGDILTINAESINATGNKALLYTAAKCFYPIEGGYSFKYLMFMDAAPTADLSFADFSDTDTTLQWKCDKITPDNSTINIYFKLVNDSSSDPSNVSSETSSDTSTSQAGPEAAPSTPSDTSTSQTGPEVAPSAPSHQCNFQWVTTVEPQPNADGLEEYKCIECGAVQEQKSLPASMTSVKNLFGFVKDVPENGTVTTDFGRLHTISDYLLKKMAERSDATVIIQFEYKNQKLQITFPAGTDYTPVLNDTDTMYGFYGVAAKLGLTVTERQ